MRRVGALLGLFFLVACNRAPADVSFRLSFDTEDATLREELVRASVRVMERRASRVDATVEDTSVRYEGNDAIIDLTLPSIAADVLRDELGRPFQFDIVRHISDDTTGSGGIVIEGQGTFVETGLTEEHISWVEWAEDGTGKGAARIALTPDGQALMKAIAAEHGDAILGILVRGVLMSKTRAEGIGEEIVILGIPNPDFAQIFADDVNVGLHVTFHPVP